MPASETVTSERYLDNVKHFFRLYDAFLKADLHVAVVSNGRNRTIILHFFKYFITLIQKKDTSFYKKEAIKIIAHYLKNNKSLKCRKSKNSIENMNICDGLNTTLSESFNIFVDAAALFHKHRKKLKQSDLKKIYYRNAEDYYKTCFPGQKLPQFRMLLASHIKPLRISHITILKQSLMEFNNAISHVNSAEKGRSPSQNIKRADTHLRRGALDFYKSIIKELSILKKINPTDLDGLDAIRCEEYYKIGYEEKDRADVFKQYFDFCDKLI